MTIIKFRYLRNLFLSIFLMIKFTNYILIISKIVFKKIFTFIVKNEFKEN